MLPPLENLSHLPSYPSPWYAPGGTLYDRDGKKVMAAGVNVQGYANIHSTPLQATNAAKKERAYGSRLSRIHKIEEVILDNPGAHVPKLQWRLNSLKRQGIPATIEFSSGLFDNERVANGMEPNYLKYLDILGNMDLSNVVMASPMNEYPLEPDQYKFLVNQIRERTGYKGLMFHSNGMTYGQSYGDLADIHVYCGNDNLKTGEFMKDLTYDVNTWTKNPHIQPNELPIVCTEVGVNWPVPNRRQSEQNIIDHLLSVGTQCITMFALATKQEHWLSTWKGVEPGDSFCFAGDSERMETLRYLCLRMAGQEVIKNIGVPGYRAERVDGDRWKLV